MQSTRNSSLEYGPDITVEYVRPGFHLDPKDVEKIRNSDDIIYRLSPDIIVKAASGSRNRNDAKALLFLEKSTSIPVPKVYALFTEGPDLSPFWRPGDSEEHKWFYTTSLVMSVIPGATLEDVWNECDSETKTTLSKELKGFLDELRQLPGTYVGSVDNGPVADTLWPPKYKNCGPFANEHDFNIELRKAYRSRALGKPLVEERMDSLLAAHKHDIKFTHADLHFSNIMVDNGHISGIIDWERAGWYPDYWEYCCAMRMSTYEITWNEFWDRTLQRPHCELLMMRELREVLMD